MTRQNKNIQLNDLLILLVITLTNTLFHKKPQKNNK